MAPPMYGRRETERNAFELTDEDINRYEVIMKQRPTGSTETTKQPLLSTGPAPDRARGWGGGGRNE